MGERDRTRFVTVSPPKVVYPGCVQGVASLWWCIPGCVQGVASLWWYTQGVYRVYAPPMVVYPRVYRVYISLSPGCNGCTTGCDRCTTGVRGVPRVVKVYPGGMGGIALYIPGWYGRYSPVYTRVVYRKVYHGGYIAQYTPLGTPSAYPVLLVPTPALAHRRVTESWAQDGDYARVRAAQDSKVLKGVAVIGSFCAGLLRSSRCYWMKDWIDEGSFPAVSPWLWACCA